MSGLVNQSSHCLIQRTTNIPLARCVAVFQHNLRNNLAPVSSYITPPTWIHGLLCLPLISISISSHTRNILTRNSISFCQPGIMHQHMEFAVNWHVISWVKCVNQLIVILADKCNGPIPSGEVFPFWITSEQPSRKPSTTRATAPVARIGFELNTTASGP